MSTGSGSIVDNGYVTVFNHRVQVCWSVDRPIGNPVRLAVFERPVNSGAAPATVGGEPFSRVPLGRKAWEGGEGFRPASQETCLSDVILLPRGVRGWGGLPLW